MESNSPQSAREIVHSLPQRFRPERIEEEDVNAVFHFNLSGPHGGEFTVAIKEGACWVNDGLHGEPNCIISAVDSVYEDIELGRMNPQMAFMMGKIRASNVMELMKFIGYFKRLYHKDH